MDNDDFWIGGGLLSAGPILPPSQEVKSGWNLIGHYGTEAKQVYCSLFSLVDTQEGFPRYPSIWGYDSLSDEFIQLDALNPSNMTEPIKCYWLEIDVDDLYVPATTCWGIQN